MNTIRFIRRSRVHNIPFADNRPSNTPWTEEESQRYYAGRVTTIELALARTPAGHPARAMMEAQLADAKRRAGIPTDAEIAQDLREIETARALEIARSLGWTPRA